MADTAGDIDLFGTKPDVTKELIKTKSSNFSTRQEYLRMKAEQEVENRQTAAVSSEIDEMPHRRTSNAITEEVIHQLHEEPEVTSFPFVDDVDGVAKTAKNNKDKALEANEHPGHKHGAKLCMMSAMVHMRCLAQKKAKSIKELKKNPRTTLDQKKQIFIENFSEDDDSDEEDGPLTYLKNCRYLRGVKEDKELSIEDIFG